VTFVAKFAMVFTPTASSLDVSRRQDELQRLLIDAGRWTAYIALPVVLLFVIQGGPLLRVWMGSKYEVGAPVLVILALGSFTTVAQMAVRNILTGVNAHGRPGVGSLLASIVSLALSVLLLGTAGWGLIGAAIAVTVPPAVVNGWYVPWYACRRFHVSFTRYVIHSLRGPTLCSLPFAGCLVGGKLLFPGHSIFGLLTGLGLGSVVLGVLYYRFVIPTSLRDRILAGARRLRVGGRRGALPGGDR
jgi:O-antigen/teichoic acid export membrane protein